MEKNSIQNGFSVGLIIVIIAVFLAVACIGWRVWESGQPNSKTASNEAAQSANKNDAATTNDGDTQQWSTFEDERLPFTFKYPNDWKVAVESYSANPFSASISLQTPDASFREEPIGSTTVIGGAEVKVDAATTSYNKIDDQFSDSQNILRLSNQWSAATASGLPAVNYEFGYESQTADSTDFLNNGLRYSVRYASANDERTSKYFNEYQALLNTFTFK